MSLLDRNNVTQTGLVVSGDVAGRDVKKTTNLAIAGDVAAGDINKQTLNIITNNIQAYFPYQKDKTLELLLSEHEKEKQLDPDYREFSEELNKYFGKAVHNNLRDLDQKLRDGNRVHLIDYAMDAKERVTKKITRLMHYKSAQEIYNYLLTNIHSAFLHQVQSKIKSKEYSAAQIDEIVTTIIIEPFFHTLQGSSLLIDKAELFGLLYFLTGNCYIEWD